VTPANGAVGENAVHGVLVGLPYGCALEKRDPAIILLVINLLVVQDREQPYPVEGQRDEDYVHVHARYRLAIPYFPQVGDAHNDAG